MINADDWILALPQINRNTEHVFTTMTHYFISSRHYHYTRHTSRCRRIGCMTRFIKALP